MRSFMTQITVLAVSVFLGAGVVLFFYPDMFRVIMSKVFGGARPYSGRKAFAAGERHGSRRQTGETRPVWNAGSSRTAAGAHGVSVWRAARRRNGRLKLKLIDSLGIDDGEAIHIGRTSWMDEECYACGYDFPEYTSDIITYGRGSDAVSRHSLAVQRNGSDVSVTVLHAPVRRAVKYFDRSSRYLSRKSIDACFTRKIGKGERMHTGGNTVWVQLSENLFAEIS